jgi:hypothetical protein
VRPAWSPGLTRHPGLAITGVLDTGRKISTIRRTQATIIFFRRDGGYETPITERVWTVMVGILRQLGTKPEQK